MSRLAEFALRYAALRAGGVKRIQAAKQAAQDVRAGGKCPECGGPLSLGMRDGTTWYGCASNHVRVVR